MGGFSPLEAGVMTLLMTNLTPLDDDVTMMSMDDEDVEHPIPGPRCPGCLAKTGTYAGVAETGCAREIRHKS